MKLLPHSRSVEQSQGPESFSALRSARARTIPMTSMPSVGIFPQGAAGIPASGITDQRVTPSQDGCPRGRWCCQFPDGSRRCVRCEIRDPWTGSCLIPHHIQCQRAGGTFAHCG